MFPLARHSSDNASQDFVLQAVCLVLCLRQVFFFSWLYFLYWHLRKFSKFPLVVCGVTWERPVGNFSYCPYGVCALESRMILGYASL